MTERQKAKKYADTEISKLVRFRDGRCVTCWSPVNLECGHLITRAKMGTRFDLKNCNAQCSTCNQEHEEEPAQYIEWFIEKYGQEEYDALVLKSNTVTRFTISELRQIGHDAKKARKDLELIRSL